MEFFIISFLLFVIGFMFIINCPPLYAFVFEHKEWKEWRYWIKHYYLFKFDYEYKGTYNFRTEDGKYMAVIWKDGCCSIHNEITQECLSTFFRGYSSKMAKLLLNKIESNKE